VKVVERVPGSGTTDFGAPGKPARLDYAALDAAEAERQTALVRAAWSVFDRVVGAAPATLRKGPRGGGRDRDAIAAHVVGAEAAYARSIGVRHPEPDWADRETVEALRADITAGLEKPWAAEDAAVQRWPPRYAARRIAWHVLDHTWEIEDKSS
jgi:hypothetical protein